MPPLASPSSSLPPQAGKVTSVFRQLELRDAFGGVSAGNAAEDKTSGQTVLSKSTLRLACTIEALDDLAVDREIAFVTGLCVGQAWVGDPAAHSTAGSPSESFSAASNRVRRASVTVSEKVFRWTNVDDLLHVAIGVVLVVVGVSL